ncbi:toxin [Pseudomonas sp. P115]|uniref:Tc toxin subunit A-related protein n=1 Tax=Pseudomonas pisciculturae TaxID=2730413 RepID=UPI00189224D4|nr:neuraminidase-like domain-containing protein [Pseudomonas pisciculturae]MBF6026388.1 toxin [Pseudomonas pisciculturae]
MSTSIDSQLQETLRDALVAFFLSEVVPKAAKFVDAGLSDKIITANDLYQYLLIDNQVSHVVQSSPVASAIASVQQYINAALMGMEPGYEKFIMQEHLITYWRTIQCQYPTWAADQQLRYNPENYIDPQLRMSKSKYFQQLEMDINQNRINFDTAQEAVKHYLNSFEEVANLTVINGYITTDDFKNGMYYFIGKSQSEQLQYYWRSVDMSQRSPKNINQPEGDKVDNPQSGAWSDWHKANLPISASAIERTIRPVYFNNRLCVFWVELIDRSREAMTVEVGKPYQPPGPQIPLPEVIVQTNPMLHLNMVYKKYDDSWSAPYTLIEAWSESALFESQSVVDLIESIAVQDNSTSPDTMFVAMYLGYAEGAANNGELDSYAFLKTAFIDKNFNVQHAFPEAGVVPEVGVTQEIRKYHVLSFGRLFAFDNKHAFQFRIPAVTIGVKSVETSSPLPADENWNFKGWWQNKIADPVKNKEVKFDTVTQRLVFESKIMQDISLPAADQLVVQFASADSVRKWNLFLRVPSVHTGAYVTLLEGSRIEVVLGGPVTGWGSNVINMTRGSQFFSGILRDTLNYETCTLPRPEGQVVNLVGKIFSTTAFSYLKAQPSELKLHTISNGTDHAFYNAISSSVTIEPAVHRFRHWVMHPLDLSNVTGGRAALIMSSPSEVRNPPDTHSVSIAINVQTLLPDWNVSWPVGQKKIPLIYGIGVERTEGVGGGAALKLTEVELEILPRVGDLLVAPRLSTRPSPTLGVAEFIDFRGSTIEKTDGSTTALRQPIRMNTLFARELINKANIALESLLDWSTQLLPEPPLDPASEDDRMDFRGANGKYFWELFLHLPFLVSHRMLLEQQFDDAERWLAFIFDPARKRGSSTSGRPDYWNVRPLMDDPDLDAVSRAPADPDGIAESHPVRYRKAVYLHYLKVLLSRGDNAYRQLTPDSLGEAKLWYVRLLDLLGPRPDVKLVDNWTPITLKTLADSSNPGLRQYEQRLIAQDQLREEMSISSNGESRYAFPEPALCLRTFTPDLTLQTLDTGYLRLAFNEKLVEMWDLVESRLSNLRNNRTLDGKPLSLSLFASPLDPRELLAAFGQGAAAGRAGRLLAQAVPPYRFTVMHGAASSAVETLIQFGQTLWSLIERKEQAQFQELQQQQMFAMAQFAIDLQKQAKVIDEQQVKALCASKAVIEGRLKFYSERVGEGIEEEGGDEGGKKIYLDEAKAAAQHMEGANADKASWISEAVGAALKLPPNAFGGGGGGGAGVCIGIPPTPSGGGGGAGSAGGWRLEGAPLIVAAIAAGIASLDRASAIALDRSEQLRERHEQWKLAKDQAGLEIKQIEAQEKVLQEQAKATAIQLRQAELAFEQAKTAYDFLGKRFTNAQLYQWLNGQFATFYYQAYDATLSLCLAAEACLQYETANFSRRFIQTGGWNDSRRGLGAGEALKLQLLNMRSAHLTNDERLLEITKTVSLRQLKAMDDSDELINKNWEGMHEDLLEHGVTRFELSAKMFEDDYPGCERRRIQRMGVSLPLVLGPYEDVAVTLTQTWSAVQLGGTLKENLQASQQIVLSHGDNDDGRFTPAGDGRYDAFEGTGAISRWALEFTEQDLDLRKRQINALPDIILHLSYTAKAGQE